MKDTAVRFSTEALVLKEKEIGESDRLVTLFTKDLGIIRAFVHGAKKINSKKSSGTSALTYSNFSIIKRRDTYKIYEVQPIRVFFSLGSDIVNLTLAQYFCELAMKLIPEGSDNPEFLRLILNSLHFLTEKEKNPILIKAITELRVASICGYAPNLIACDVCGKFSEESMKFSFDEGKIYCRDCVSPSNTIILSATLLSAMRHIVFSKFENIYSFDIPKNDANLLSSVTEKYLSIQTDFKFSTLQFFNTIKE